MAQITSEKLSKTSPQQAIFLRNQIFLSRIVKLRNEDYEVQKRAMLAEKRINHPDLAEKDLKVFSEVFARKFFRPEYSALAEYQATEQKREVLLGKTELTTFESKSLERYELTLSIEPAAYAAQSLHKPESITQFKKDYPGVADRLKNDIKAIAKSDFDDIRPSVAHMPATVTLFNKVFPNVQGELNKLSFSNSVGGNLKAGAKAGLSLLSNGLKYANPPGAIMSWAISAIVMSDSMKPMRKQIEKSMDHVVESTGLKSWMKDKLKKSSMAKNVAIGVSSAAAVTLVSIGVLQPEVAQLMVQDLFDHVSEIGEINNEPVMANVSPSLDSEFLNKNSDSPGMSGSDLDKIGYGAADNIKNGLSSLEDKAGKVRQWASESLGGLVGEHDSEISQEVDMPPPPIDMPPPPIDMPPPPAVDMLPPAVSEDTVKNMANAIDAEAYAPDSTTVERGDTPYELVAEEFRKAGIPYNYAALEDYWALVAEQNGIKDINKIFPGQVIEWENFSVPEPLIDSSSIAEHMVNNTDFNLTGFSPVQMQEVLDFEGPLSPEEEMLLGAVEQEVERLKGLEIPEPTPTYRPPYRA